MWILASILAIALLLWLGWQWNTRPRLIRTGETPDSAFPASGFSHDGFEALLRRFVNHSGEVDYAAWHADPGARQALDRYLAAIALYSPDNAPERFADENDRLAYWVYAYNAFVIRGVLEHWPLDSVTDLRAPIEVVRGLGFFYNLHFVAGGERMSLYTLEHRKVLKPFRDPRAHFVLNCASGSCPLIPTELATGEAFGRTLDEAALAFVTDPANVRVDHSRRRIELNRIFSMYTRDFVDDLRRRGLPSQRGVVDYIASIAPADLRDELAQAAGYEVVFHDYDWTINSRSGEVSGGVGD